MKKKYQKPSFLLPTLKNECGIQMLNKALGKKLELSNLVPQSYRTISLSLMQTWILVSSKDVTIALLGWFLFLSKVWCNLVKSFGRPSRTLSGKLLFPNFKALMDVWEQYDNISFNDYLHIMDHLESDAYKKMCNQCVLDHYIHALWWLTVLLQPQVDLFPRLLTSDGFLTLCCSRIHPKYCHGGSC